MRREEARAQILRLKDKMSSGSDNIVTGIRIIDVDLLTKKMCCLKRNCLLHFSHIYIYYLSSKLYIILNMPL